MTSITEKSLPKGVRREKRAQKQGGTKKTHNKAKKQQKHSKKCRRYLNIIIEKEKELKKEINIGIKE